MIDFIIDILQDIANLLEGVRDKNPHIIKIKNANYSNIIIDIINYNWINLL